MRFTQRACAVAVWLAAFALLGAGYSRVEIRDAGRLAGIESDAKTLQAEVARAEAIVHDRFELRAARKRIVTDIRAQASFVGQRELGQLLVPLDQAMQRTGIALVSIDPTSGVATSTKDHYLRARSVRVTMRGKFASLLRFLPSFAGLDPLVRIHGIQITSNDSGPGTHPLAFAIDADVYALDGPIVKE